jgi:hypothetical protein
MKARGLNIGRSAARWIATCLTAGMLLGGLPVTDTAQAAVSYQISETVTDAKPEGQDTGIAGNYMAYFADDENGTRQLYVKDLATGTAVKVTSSGAAKRNLSIKGRLVVWSVSVAPFHWDVYSYDVQSKQTTKLNSAAGDFELPTTDGTFVAWGDQLAPNTMYIYDPASGHDRPIGKGLMPKIAAGKVLYKNVSDGGLSLYDLSSGQATPVVQLPYGDYVQMFDYNGTYAVWFQHVGTKSKYVELNLTDPQAKPQDLTPLVSRSTEYVPLFLGDQTAAWVEDDNGLPAVKGANVALHETFVISPPSAANNLYAVSGNQVVVRSATGNFSYMLPIRIETNPSAGGYAGPSAPAETAQRLFGRDGGELASQDGSIQVSAGKDTFSKDTYVSLREAKELEPAGKGIGKAVGGAWEVGFEAAAKPLSVTMTYPQDQVLPQQALKLGIYRYDTAKGTWLYVGGTVDPVQRKVTTTIAEPGTYALLLHEVSFDDVRGHWAQQPIEILASRWLVDGVSATKFAPDESLTRAQFTKMLAGALGLQEEHPIRSTFTDIGTDHWSLGWVEAAYKAGLVQGDAGRFEPDQLLTREQMMVLLIRALGLESRAKSMTAADIEAALSGYGDADRISPWAKAYVAAAVQNKLIEGDASGVHPTDSSTRAQAAAVMLRLLEQIKKL